MLKWIPYAMVRITTFFIAGILVGIYFPDFVTERIAFLLFVILVLGYVGIYLAFRHHAVLSVMSGLLGLLSIFFAGYLNVLDKTDSRCPQHFSHIDKPIEFYLATLRGAPEIKPKSVRFEVEIVNVKSGDRWTPVTGKCLIYVSRSGNQAGVMELGYGDVLLVKGPPVKLLPPANPGEFDFRRFLSYRNISHQQFARPEQIRRVEHADARNILYYAQRARARASIQIRKFVSGEREQAITMALVLGVVEGLDNDLQNAYAASGAMHVLSVSGLHVGVIYAIILFLLKPISSVSWSRWLVASLSLTCLWIYAFVTGLSPSVLRAVMMFSFVVIAQPVGRNTNIYNTLAASAFLLLVFDPYLIMSVGFQLSYLAVMGIVYLQKPLYNVWEPASLFWDKLWQLTCVSIVAQLATFALGLYYFHQFPVYSLLSNLLVIPLSTGVLVAGMALLAFSWVPWLASGMGYLLQWLIRLLNGSVFMIEELPFSVIGGVQITAMQCILLMILVVSFVLLLETRKFRFLVSAFLVLAIFCWIQWQHFLSNKNKRQLIVYAIPGHSAWEWIAGGRSFFYCDSVLLHDPQRIRFHVRPNHLLSGAIQEHTNLFDNRFQRSYPGCRFFICGTSKILWIDQPDSDLPDNLETNYLIIGRNALRSLEVIRHKVKFRQLILDSSNSRSYEARIKNEAISKGIAVYAVAEQGAFTITL
jgi:competence protein ComEC